MKEQYQKEISQIHVPAELLAKTKQAMKEEEERKTSEEKNNKVVSFKKVSMAAAAAVLLLLVVPAASGLLKDEGSQKSQEMQLHLAGQNDIELQKIEAEEGESSEEKGLIEKIVDKLEEIFK